MQVRLFTFLTCLGLTASVHAEEKIKPQTIDIVICLDTSGSMDGLIESAKGKLWAIVNDLAKVKPTPDLRVALYQFGNDGLSQQTGWVEQLVPLTTDLDAVYQKLMPLRTNGGTELVARVTKRAIEDMRWSDQVNALKQIYVCGNEEANQDQMVSLKEVAELARKKGIYVNTIYCGSNSSGEASLWKEFALMAGGKYANIDQNAIRHEIAIATPFDKELEKLSGEFEKTAIRGGRDGKAKTEQLEAFAKELKQAAPSAALDRAAAQSGKLIKDAKNDLLDRLEADKEFDIKKLKNEELPDEMKKMKPEEREAYLKTKAAERAKLQERMSELATKRARYIDEERKKAPAPANAAEKQFDAAIREIQKVQAAEKGIKIPD
jgi:Mg-chelatase subunit ChlD